MSRRVRHAVWNSAEGAAVPASSFTLAVVPAVTLALMLALTPLPSQAKEATPLAEDPAIEQRLMDISEELRCLVCQNESLAGSRADLAQDLRREVREQLKAGKSDEEVKDFLVSRYGDFVLYRPQVKPTTYLLWAGPFVLLAAGLFGLLRFLRRRASEPAAADVPLSDAERQRAEALLKDTPVSEKDAQP